MKHNLTKGFSLTELLIAVGLLGGIALIAMNFMSMQSNEMKKGHIHENVSQAFFTINQALSIHEGCVETFVKPGNIRPEGTGTEIENIYFRAGAPAFQKNAPIGQKGASHAISISSMTLQNFSFGATNYGNADFLVKLKTKDNKNYEQKFIVNVVVKNGVVTDCINKNESILDCRGEWSTCSAACDGGTQTYTIVTAEKNGGEACPHTSNESRACNTQSCFSWVTSEWSTCSGGAGNWSYGPWGTCEGGRVEYKETCGGCNSFSDVYFQPEGTCVKCGGHPACQESCSWLGTKTREATCNATSNSGTQTRAVNCQNQGAIVSDSNCSGLKPSSTQQCSPTGEDACGTREAISSDCPSTLARPSNCAKQTQYYCFIDRENYLKSR